MPPRANPERRMSIALANLVASKPPNKCVACCISMERVSENGRALMKRMGYRPGFPDWIFIGTEGRVLFMELKTPVGTLTDSQRGMHHVLRLLGHVVVVRRTALAAYQTAVRFGAGQKEFAEDE